MITGILIAILCFEIIRLYLYIQDSRRVNKANKHSEEQQKRALEFAKQQHSEWKLIRKAEIEELRQLAKESDTMKQIYDEYKTSIPKAKE